jgi:hypothetical protein
MSPPEVWGPAVWTLFHTLAEKINEEAYPYISVHLFKMITRICKFLPCPDCSTDASNFLAKIKMSDLKTKTDFKNTFYLFHNYVNAKKRKRLFNYSNMNVYSKYRLVDVVNNFISKYHTKGNMKLLTESFQRQLVIKDFKNWFTNSINAFIPRVNIPPSVNMIESNEKVITVEPKSEEIVEPKKTTEIVETSEIIEEQNGQMVEEPKSEETVEPISDVSAEPKESTEIIEICEHMEEQNNPNENIETNNDMEPIYAEQKEQIVENVDETMNEPKLEDIPEISSNESKKKKKNKHKK